MAENENEDDEGLKRFFAAVGLHADAVARYAANLSAPNIETKAALRAVASESFLKKAGVKDEHVGPLMRKLYSDTGEDTVPAYSPTGAFARLEL